MRICLVTPAPAGSLAGNRVTAVRWARILRQLGHRVRIRHEYAGQACDCLVALHAVKSFPAIRRFRQRYPDRPLLVALTGTDLYGGLRRQRAAWQALKWATRLIVLQPLGIEELPPEVHTKTRTILQSVAWPRQARKRPAPSSSCDVLVIGHLRPVKDPFRAALASRYLPRNSRIRILHLGAALTQSMADRARFLAARLPRYQWLGARSRSVTLARLSQSQLLVVSSRREGGPNVISEAIAVGTPVLATRIPGCTGLLAPDYPGYFRVGDTRGLAEMLARFEWEREFRRELNRHLRRLRPQLQPRRELAAWRQLLSELTNVG